MFKLLAAVRHLRPLGWSSVRRIPSVHTARLGVPYRKLYVTIDKDSVPHDLTYRRQLFDAVTESTIESSGTATVSSDPLSSQGTNASYGNKLALFRELLIGHSLREYPFAVTALWAYDPERLDKGIGDLVLAKSNGREILSRDKGSTQTPVADVLVIELSHIDYSKSGKRATRARTAKRRTCRRRLESSMEQWREWYPHDRVTGATVYNAFDDASGSTFLSQSPQLPPYHLTLVDPHATTSVPVAAGESLFRISSYLQHLQLDVKEMDPLERKTRVWLAEKVGRVFAGAPQMENEMRLIYTLLQQYNVLEYPYAVEAEWEYTPGHPQHGRGDLVFSNTRHVQFHSRHNPCSVLIVECKYLDVESSGTSARSRRRMHRRKAELQVHNSMLAWKEAHPADSVHGVIFTNVRPYFSQPVSAEQVLGGGRDNRSRWPEE